MSARIAVLRPEPGNAATAAQIVAAGAEPVRLPLFATEPLDWTAPDPRHHDALILTSANAVRLAGPGLARLAALPVYAVGAATAAAARAVGLTVAASGDGDAMSLAERARAASIDRALHLAGRDRAHAALPGVTLTLPVYASAAVPVTPAALARLAGTTALLHSARAGARLADLVADRARIALVAISAAAGDAAGTGWASLRIAARPDDAALIAAAMVPAD